MEKQLEARVKELKKIITKEPYVKRMRYKYEISGGGDGHSWNDAPDVVENPVLGSRYTHSLGERIRARAELRRIRRSSNDWDTRMRIGEILGHSYKSMKYYETLRKAPVKTLAITVGKTALITGSLAADAVVICYLLNKLTN